MASATENEWDRKSVKECIEALAGLPDFERMILPKGIYEEFNIPIPDFLCKNVMEYLAEHKKAYYMSHVEKHEERKGDGILRVVPEDVLVLETKTLAEIEEKPEEEEHESAAEEKEEPHFTDADFEGLDVPSPLGCGGFICSTN
jgi:hypothetical protein